MTALSHLLPITDQLRNYGWTGQWGLEKTYQEYLDKMIAFMAECMRVLKKTGTMWINLGDSYLGTGGDRNGNSQGVNSCVGGTAPDNCPQTGRYESKKALQKSGVQTKSLMLIPHRFAIRCCDELKLILRNDIIWAKRNGMPESVTDRFSKKHEFIFFFVKSQKYYFDLDAVRDKISTSTEERRQYPWKGNEQRDFTDGKQNNMSKFYEKTSQTKIPKEEAELFGSPRARNHRMPKFGGTKGDGLNKHTTYSGNEWEPRADGKNPGDVSDFWDIVTKGSREKHFAKFNSELIDKPIIAGCPENGIILDPFAGTGETPVRAAELGRKYIAIDGKPEYCKIMERRLASIPEYMFSNNK